MEPIKKTKTEIECDFCGVKFMQSRWWQVYCSRKCREALEKTAKAEMKKLLPEVQYLRRKVKELEDYIVFQANNARTDPECSKASVSEQEIMSKPMWTPKGGE